MTQQTTGPHRSHRRTLFGATAVDTSVDLGHRMRRGRNEIEVEVASTLLNRLRTVTPDVYGVAVRRAYGLVGPVRLVPYVEKVMR